MSLDFLKSSSNIRKITSLSSSSNKITATTTATAISTTPPPSSSSKHHQNNKKNGGTSGGNNNGDSENKQQQQQQQREDDDVEKEEKEITTTPNHIIIAEEGEGEEGHGDLEKDNNIKQQQQQQQQVVVVVSDESNDDDDDDKFSDAIQQQQIVITSSPSLHEEDEDQQQQQQQQEKTRPTTNYSRPSSASSSPTNPRITTAAAAAADGVVAPPHPADDEGVAQSTTTTSSTTSTTATARGMKMLPTAQTPFPPPVSPNGKGIIGLPLDEDETETGEGGEGGGNNGQNGVVDLPQPQPRHQVLLEDRVSELETKLSVLSRLLQFQHQQQGGWDAGEEAFPLRCATPPPPPHSRGGGIASGSSNSIITPSSSRGTSLSPQPSIATDACRDPHLESPAPSFVDRQQLQLQQHPHQGQQQQSPTTNQQYPHLLPPDLPSSSNKRNQPARKYPSIRQPDLFEPPPTTETTEAVGEEGIQQEEDGTAGTTPTAAVVGGSHTGATPSRDNTTTTRGRRKQQQNNYNGGQSNSIIPQSQPQQQSPIPPSPQPQQLQTVNSHSRNLSFNLLFDGDEDAYQKGHDVLSSVPPTTSMTISERQWLQPKILQYVQQQQQLEVQQNQKKQEGSSSPTTSNNNNKRPGVTKMTTVSSLETLLADNTSPSRLGSSSRRNNNEDNNPDDRSVVTFASSVGSGEKETTKDKQENKDKDNNSNSEIDSSAQIRNNWLNYLNSFHEPSSGASDVDARMQEFIQVPGKVENLLCYGLVICVDSFLYMITILPIRCVWSCFLLVLNVFWLVPKRRFGKQQTPREVSPWRFHRQHSYQMIQVFILYTIYKYVLCQISIGKMYHWIRGQSMIKLYLLIAIVEVFDRLLSSLGQDCLDSLYWNTVNRPRSRRMIISVIVVWMYATCHSLLLFLHVETLNVAMNSDDQALLALLISGNFAEIKSTVFKKYNKPALFKITASDICERFKLGLFLSLVLLLNVCQGMESRQFASYGRICGIIWLSELVSDWIKHSFITKFNFLPSKVYPEFALLLAGDVTGIGHESINLDRSHAVVKRIGFAQTPLVCLMFRLVAEAMKYAQRNPFWHSSMGERMMQSRLFGFTSMLGGWLVLLAVKLTLGTMLQRASLAKLRAAPEVVPMKKLPGPKTKKA